jgi:hypothetical protein
VRVCVHVYIELTTFLNYFGVLSRLCQGGLSKFSGVKFLRGQHNALSRVTCCHVASKI